MGRGTYKVMEWPAKAPEARFFEHEDATRTDRSTVHTSVEDCWLSLSIWRTMFIWRPSLLRERAPGLAPAHIASGRVAITSFMINVRIVVSARGIKKGVIRRCVLFSEIHLRQREDRRQFILFLLSNTSHFRNFRIRFCKCMHNIHYSPDEK